MTIRAQVGEERDSTKRGYMVTQWAEYGGYRAEVKGWKGGSPDLNLARLLVAAGYDPAEPYEAARGEKVGMRYATLGWAAEHTVREDKDGEQPPRFVKYRPFPDEAAPQRGAAEDASDEDD